MKQILIIADGLLAKTFIDKLHALRSNLHHYTIVTQDESILNSQNISENFSFYNFDPTSFSKLKGLINGYFSQFIIIMKDELEAVASYENLRQITAKTDIVFLNLWDLNNESMQNDKHIEFVDTKSIISTHFVGHLPDMPSLADNIGLGQGEIMEVKVPIGSSYLYRHLSSVQQKKWRISLIYRSGEIILPKPNVMIRPNDTLLIVGDPIVLQSVYRSIKREPGQFPSPFGSNIYIFLDMKIMSDERLNKLIDDSLFLHSRLKNRRLIFKVINPTLNISLARLKDIMSDDGNKSITILIDYFASDNSNMKTEILGLDVGLVLTDNEYFFKFKQLFYILRLPILKLGIKELRSLKHGAILSDGKENIENQSAVIMDFSSQLSIDVKLYYFDNKNSDEHDINEHFESISKLFEKSISIENSVKNPLLRLSNNDDMIQFITFDKRLAKDDKFIFLSTNISRHYKKMSKNSQLFIPIGS